MEDIKLYDLDAEESLIGSVLLSDTAYQKVWSNPYIILDEAAWLTGFPQPVLPPRFFFYAIFLADIELRLVGFTIQPPFFHNPILSQQTSIPESSGKPWPHVSTGHGNIQLMTALPKYVRTDLTNQIGHMLLQHRNWLMTTRYQLNNWSILLFRWFDTSGTA